MIDTAYGVKIKENKKNERGGVPHPLINFGSADFWMHTRSTPGFLTIFSFMV